VICDLGCDNMQVAPRSRKINLKKVQASLNAVCPKCGRLIPPAEVRRNDFERIECPCAENSLCPALKGESGPVQAQKRPNLFCGQVGPFLS
jgi:hypothetical protein